MSATDGMPVFEPSPPRFPHRSFLVSSRFHRSCERDQGWELVNHRSPHSRAGAANGSPVGGVLFVDLFVFGGGEGRVG